MEEINHIGRKNTEKEEWNVEALAEIPLRREKSGRVERWKDGKME